MLVHPQNQRRLFVGHAHKSLMRVGVLRSASSVYIFCSRTTGQILLFVSCRTVALRKKLYWRTGELQLPPIEKNCIFIAHKKLHTFEIYFSNSEQNIISQCWHKTITLGTRNTRNFIYLKTASNASVSLGKTTGRDLCKRSYFIFCFKLW